MGRAMAAVVLLTPVSGWSRRWNPPRTPDGQPDIQGYWNTTGPTAASTFATYTVEGGHPFKQTVVTGAVLEQWAWASEAHSIVIDPPSGNSLSAVGAGEATGAL
jgi:hypothetical protein